MITLLAGGVGAAKFIEGLIRIVPNENITVIVNTGDDIELYGLHVSPDLDIIMYTLAGLVDDTKGWGIKQDTFHCLETLQTYGFETWFKLGDKDLATHIFRTSLLKSGAVLSEVTSKLCSSLGLMVKVLPMSNDRFVTKIVIKAGTLHFQEYFVKKGARDEVIDVVFEGADEAQPSPGVIEAIMNAETVILCPSNPIVSIGTILSVKNVRRALKETNAKLIAISPIVGGAPIKGPADKLMQGLGLTVSAYSVANLYRDFLDVFVIDNVDKREKKHIEKLGVRVIVTNTVMKNLRDKTELASTVLKSVSDIKV